MSDFSYSEMPRSACPRNFALHVPRNYLCAPITALYYESENERYILLSRSYRDKMAALKAFDRVGVRMRVKVIIRTFKLKTLKA